MEILKVGKLSKTKKYTLVCTQCKTKFRFSKSEATVTTDRNESVLLIKCPSCGKRLTHNLH